MQPYEEFIKSIAALSKMVEDAHKVLVENIANMLANIAKSVNMEYLADIGKKWGEFIETIAFYSTDNILNCANYGIGYISYKDLDIILKQNYQSQEQADNFLQSLEDDYISGLLEYVKAGVDAYYGSNDYVKQIINESIFNFENKKFTFCTIGLVTLYEELGNDVGNLLAEIEDSNFSGTKSKFFPKLTETLEYLKELESKAERSTNDDITNLSYAEYNRFLSVLTLLEKMFIKTDQADGSIPNRHEVAHRTRTIPYQKYDCIKLYILLAEILEFLVAEKGE